MIRKSYFASILILMFLISGCNWRKNRTDIDTSGIQIPAVRIHRYDLNLFKIPYSDLENGLQSIQHEYYFFLGTDLADPVKLEKMKAYLQNPRNLDFQKAVKARFTDLSLIEKGMTDLFRHYKYYFPEKRLFRVYSYISGGDYDNQVQLADSVMIIALDTYLGKDFKPYIADGLPLYKAEKMTSDHIVPDAARELVNSVFPKDQVPVTLLDHMIEAGKRLYVMKAFIPDTPDRMIFDYSQKKVDWLKKNESHVWAAIIENRMLFSGSSDLLRTFFSDGPCTPDFGADSPPRMGEWIGYQIIREYMEKNPKITIPDMLSEKDSQGILFLSGYKPEK